MPAGQHGLVEERPHGSLFQSLWNGVKEVVLTIKRIGEEQRLSGAVVHGGLVWLAGQVADDATLDTEGQTADILRQIDALLAEAGTDKSRLLSITVVLAEIRDAPAMNRAWDAWLDPRAKPARMTVQAPLVDPAWRVEITGVAALPRGADLAALPGGPAA
jgi:enamine deaminase RidA (YjgF/YER057c/UK114 family)